MILSDQEISKLVQSNNLIENFVETNLQAASYDVSAGSQVQIFNRVQGILDLRDKSVISMTNKEVDLNYGYQMMPGEYILVKTKEILHMTDDLIAYVKPRTTFSRIGLLLTEQYVNPSFEGYLYLGLHNISPNVIKIVSGLKIGHIFFEKVQGNISSHLLYRNKPDAKYQNENSFINPRIDEFNEEYKQEYNRLMNKLMGA